MVDEQCVFIVIVISGDILAAPADEVVNECSGDTQREMWNECDDNGAVRERKKSKTIR